MRTLVEYINENIEKEVSKLADRLDKAEKKAEEATKQAEEAEKRADDAEEQAKDAEKEANKAEDSIKTEKDFKSYAENKFKIVFGDKLDKDKMNKVIDGLLKDNAELVEKGDWGELVGKLNKSFGG